MKEPQDKELNEDELDSITGGAVPPWGGGPPDHVSLPNVYHGKKVDTGTDDAPHTESF